MAPPDSTQLSFDVCDLYNAGGQILPGLATEFANANRRVAGVNDGLTGTFHQPDHFGGTLSPEYFPWRTLSDELQTILADMSANLELVGEALCLAAGEYARSDRNAEEELKRLRKEHPTPTVPVPRYPGTI